ncbi:hypothetical protein [Nostoc sp. PCC 9305]|uniref:hypothetical protein n=1 Tax=Nostoc sp. PCC 9305 TaxID=296636 RepID=UPI0039C660AB
MNEFKDFPIFLAFVIFAIALLNQRKIAQHSVVHRLRYLCQFAPNLINDLLGFIGTKSNTISLSDFSRYVEKLTIDHKTCVYSVAS